MRYLKRLLVTAALATTVLASAMGLPGVGASASTSLFASDHSSGELRIYGWLPSIDGTVGLDPALASSGPAAADFDQGGILDLVDGGFMATIEHRFDRLGVYGDLVFVSLSKETSTRRNALSARVDLDASLSTAALTYKVYGRNGTRIEALVGGRVHSVKGGLTVDHPLGTLEGSKRKSWSDPVIGVRAYKDLNDRVGIGATAIVGPFGTSSDSLIDLLAVLDIRMTSSLYANLGYRHMAVEYNNNVILLDMEFSGPFAGVSYRW